MKVLYLNAGNETGGGMHHILRMLEAFKEYKHVEFALGVFEKKALYEKAKELSIETVHFKAAHRFDFSVVKQIADYIKEQRVTLVHTHGPRANVYMSRVKKQTTVPWLTTIHSDPEYDFKGQGIKGKILTYLHLRTLVHADFHISVCHAHCPTLVNRGIVKERITIIHNGLHFTKPEGDEQSKLKMRKHLGIPSDAFVMVKVARLEIVKGHDLIIQALRNVRNQTDLNAHLVFVGDGSCFNDLKQLASELGISERVHFFGERLDVPLFYQAADMVVLTSRSEGFPYVLLEAAQYKKPVIATDVGDVHHLLKDETIGWKIPANDIIEIQRALMEAGEEFSQGILMKKGEKFHDFAKNHFSIDKSANEVYNVYKRISS